MCARQCDASECARMLTNEFNAHANQVGSMLINRVADTGVRWHQEVTNAAPRVTPIIDLTLDDAPVKRAIDNLNFIQLRRKYRNIEHFIRVTAYCEHLDNLLFFHPPPAVRDCDERLITGKPRMKITIYSFCSVGRVKVNAGKMMFFFRFSATSDTINNSRRMLGR